MTPELNSSSEDNITRTRWETPFGGCSVKVDYYIIVNVF